jgi:protein TonB
MIRIRLKLLSFFFLVTIVAFSQNSVTAKSDTTVKDLDEVADNVEELPTYPGGFSKLYAFLEANLQYPKVCKDSLIEGRVVCQFVVGKDGSIRDVKVIRSAHPLLDAEAIRVIKMMPKWIPGKKAGLPVAYKLSLPIAFSLPEK